MKSLRQPRIDHVRLRTLRLISSRRAASSFTGKEGLSKLFGWLSVKQNRPSFAGLQPLWGDFGVDSWRESLTTTGPVERFRQNLKQVDPDIEVNWEGTDDQGVFILTLKKGNRTQKIAVEEAHLREPDTAKIYSGLFR